MTVDEVMGELESLGNERVRAQNAKNGADLLGFGVKLGDLRAVAKRIKTNTPFARELWATGNLDARFLALLVVRPKELSTDELTAMVDETSYAWLADWLNSYVVKAHPQKEELRLAWSESPQPMRARSAWSLTTERVAKSPEGLDLDALLDRIEREMADAPPASQWTMNHCLAEIGIGHPDYRERALAIGESLGVYRDYPVSKGCTSPFAPIWIDAMVNRKTP